MARRSDGDLWILLLFLVLALGGLTAGSSLYRGIMTVGYIGGITAAWYRAYAGQTLPAQAVKSIHEIAALVRAGSHKAAAEYLEIWLDAFDPAGLVRAAIRNGEIQDLP